MTHPHDIDELNSAQAGPVRELATNAPIVGRVGARPQSALDLAVQHRRAALIADAGAGPHYVAAGASYVGPSHEATGGTRQDSFAFSADVDGRLVVVIADGLGSRAASQVGATLFCEQVLAIASEEPGKTPDQLLLSASEKAKNAAAYLFDLDGRDIAFVGLVLTADQDGCHIARVGDCSAFVLGAEAEFREVFAAPEGALNVVGVALPHAGTEDVESTHVPAPHGPVVATTDGLALDLRMSPGIKKWLAECWKSPIGSFAMADSLRYERQGSLDDRTGVVLWPTLHENNSGDIAGGKSSTHVIIPSNEQ